MTIHDCMKGYRVECDGMVESSGQALGCMKGYMARCNDAKRSSDQARESTKSHEVGGGGIIRLGG